MWRFSGERIPTLQSTEDAARIGVVSVVGAVELGAGVIDCFAPGGRTGDGNVAGVSCDMGHGILKTYYNLSDNHVFCGPTPCIMPDKQRANPTNIVHIIKKMMHHEMNTLNYILFCFLSGAVLRKERAICFIHFRVRNSGWCTAPSVSRIAFL